MNADTGDIKTGEELQKLGDELASKFVPITEADFERLRRYGTAEERKKAFGASLEELKTEVEKAK